MKRPPLILLAGALVIAVVGGAYLWRLGDVTRPSQVLDNAPADVGGPFSLVDQNGKRVTDVDFRGRYMLVFFGFTFCPDVCPTTLAVISAALDKMGPHADDIVPVFITVDPERDTPEMIKSYLDAFGPRFVGLSGTTEEIGAVTKAYRVYSVKRPLESGGYTMDHSSVIYLMDRNGAFLDNYNLELGPEGLAAELEKSAA